MAWVPWFIRRRRDRLRAEELETHLALHIEDLMARGVPRDEALRQARMLLGNMRSRREEIDAMQSLPFFETLARDVRYGLRMIRRAPGFACTVIATLAVVIGANTAVFSLANGLLLADLPYPSSSELHLLAADVRTPRGQFSGTGQDGFVWEALSRTPWAERAAVMTGWSSSVNLSADNQALFVDQQRVSAGFFRVLGVSPARGREFLPEEDRPGGPAVVILSHQLWQRLFAGQDNVLGTSIMLRGEPWQVVGVMPEGFRSTADADLWTPLRPSTSGEGGGTNYTILIRVPGGTSIDAATAQMRPLLDPSLRERGLGDEVTATVSLLGLREQMTAEHRDVLYMLGAAAIVVLIIACANLATLMLARGSSRTREIATRMALGSGRRVVVRQLMVEAMVLAALGGAGGLLLGGLGLEWLQQLAGERFSDWTRVSMDARVIAVSGGLALLTSLAFGLGPAWQASKLDVRSAMNEGSTRAVAGGGRHWTRRGLIVAEVALGVVLLVCAGLLTRTFVNLTDLDAGFETEGLVTTQVSLLDARYPGPDEVRPLFARVLEQLERDPAVASAAVSLGLPFQRALNMGFRFSGDEAARTASVMYVSPSFFDTFGIPLRDGRTFTSGDIASSRPVVIVNEAMQRLYAKGDPVLGRELRVSGQEWDVVGVVADVQQRPGFTVTGMVPGPLVASPTIYVPVAQMTTGIAGAHLWFGPAFTVRATSRADAERALASAVAAADPMLPIGRVQTLDDLRASATGAERLLMTLVGVLAVAALVLMAVGLHGVIANAVGERTREFGIRLALGATPGSVLWLVVSSGVGLAVVGVVIGLGLARPAVALVASSLYGVTESDPFTHVGAAAFLLVVATVASLLPALRVRRVDPGLTLKG